MTRLGSTFKGNPNTNAAARYSAALKRWRDGGCKGPMPVNPNPPTVMTREEAESPAEKKRRIEREKQQKQGKLF